MWTYGLGLDPGIRDRNGITVVAWRSNDPCCYVAKSYSFEGTPTDLAEEVKRLMAEQTFAYIVADQGGMGLAFAEEMRRRHHLPIEAAEKSGKAAALRLMNAELKSGNIKVVRMYASELLEEWDNVPWAENGMTEAAGYKCDLLDSCLYAWRKCMAFIERPAPPPLTHTETFQALEQRMLDQDERDVIEAEREASEWAAW